MKNELIKILSTAIKFIIIFILIDFSLGTIATKLIYAQKTGKYGKLIEGLDKSNAAIFVFGSSHALRHYDNDLIEQQYQSSCYNVGSKGQKMLFQTVLLKTLLERHAPKTIILDIDDDWLYEFPAAYDRLGALHPFYSKHRKVLRQSLQEYDKYTGLKLAFKSYQQNSTFLHVVRYFLFPEPKSTNGFEPLNGKLNASDSVHLKEIFNTVNTNTKKIDTNFIHSLEAFIQLSKSNNIELVLCISPNLYYNNEKDNISYHKIIDIAKSNHILLYDFTNDTKFLNQYTLFNDVDHLNIDGAKLYTQQLLDSLLNK
ncbi:MAG: hypothetical protein R2801_07170 [Chitinophagales bacterium]